MLGIGGVGGDVGVVPVAAAGHGDVEVLPRRRRRGDHVRGVDGDALGAVRGDRVPELDLLGHIRGREHHRPAESSPVGADGDRPVLAHGRDRPPVAVAHPCSAVLRAQMSVVLARDDQIALRCARAVMQEGLTSGGDGAVEDEVGAGTLVELGHRLPRLRDQDRRPPLLGVVAPGGVGGIDHRLLLSSADPAVLDEGVDRARAAVAQVQRVRLLPRRREAMYIGELGGVVAVVHEHPERPARVDGLEPRPVTDQEDFRAGFFCHGGDAVEGAGAGQRCLVEDYELSLLEGATLMKMPATSGRCCRWRCRAPRRGPARPSPTGRGRPPSRNRVPSPTPASRRSSPWSCPHRRARPGHPRPGRRRRSV